MRFPSTLRVQPTRLLGSRLLNVHVAVNRASWPRLVHGGDAGGAEAAAGCGGVLEENRRRGDVAGRLPVAGAQRAARRRLGLVRSGIEAMPAALKDDSPWVYWLGRACKAQGRTNRPMTLSSRSPVCQRFLWPAGAGRTGPEDQHPATRRSAERGRHGAPWRPTRVSAARSVSST